MSCRVGGALELRALRLAPLRRFLVIPSGLQLVPCLPSPTMASAVEEVRVPPHPPQPPRRGSLVPAAPFPVPSALRPLPGASCAVGSPRVPGLLPPPAAAPGAEPSLRAAASRESYRSPSPRRPGCLPARGAGSGERGVSASRPQVVPTGQPARWSPSRWAVARGVAGGVPPRYLRADRRAGVVPPGGVRSLAPAPRPRWRAPRAQEPCCFGRRGEPLGAGGACPRAVETAGSSVDARGAEPRAAVSWEGRDTWGSAL